MQKVIFLLIITAVFSAGLLGQTPEPKRITVGKVELAYIEKGSGEPLILLHGGQADYRAWLPHMTRLAENYRVISYSRRYNYPNNNPIDPKDHSPYIDADDLAGLIDQLGLKRVHLVGTSIGSFISLAYAIRHPDNVASLTLAEPAIHAWVTDSPEYKDFMKRAWRPAAEAFRAGDDRTALKLLNEVFTSPGSFDRMPKAAQDASMSNAKFFRAATLSKHHSPKLSKERVRKLTMPILLVMGENTFAMSKVTLAEVQKVLPRAKTIVIPKTGHGAVREDAGGFTDALLAFLGST